jgi:catechol 2,3-dioxygenase-like lactoylglutathione lyase family enzyme
MRPTTDGILESSLYVADLRRSIQFYQDVFGFRIIKDFAERGCALQAGARQVLLLFKKGASRAISAPHDRDGELHLAFAISKPALSQWESWLKEKALPSKKERNGKAAERASTFAIRIAICSKS